MANTKKAVPTITLEQKAELNAKINMIKSLAVDIYGLSDGLNNLTSDEIGAIEHIISLLQKSSTAAVNNKKVEKSTEKKATSVKDYYNVSDIVDLTKIVPGNVADIDDDEELSQNDIDTADKQMLDDMIAVDEEVETSKSTNKSASKSTNKSASKSTNKSAKKSTTKKPVDKKTTAKKSTDKKKATKKATAEKDGTKKAATKKATTKKATAKKPAAKKSTAKKTSTKKASSNKTSETEV